MSNKRGSPAAEHSIYIRSTTPSDAESVVGMPWGDADDGKMYTCTQVGPIVYAEVPGTGAPADANYLVGTANADLSAEIPVGTTPGGELGGTWAAPTVGATHSGSAHHVNWLGPGITVEDPTNAEDITIGFTNKAVTVTEMRSAVRGTTPSVTWTIRHGTDRSAAGAEVVTSGTTTTSESTGDDVTSFNDATIVADSFIWAETTAKSGTVTELHISIIGTVD